MREGWDLADLYRDRLTLRQLRVRIKALPYGSPLHEAVAEEQEKAEARQRVADVEDALAPFKH